jgi:hypothetical protein
MYVYVPVNVRWRSEDGWDGRQTQIVPSSTSDNRRIFISRGDQSQFFMQKPNAVFGCGDLFRDRSACLLNRGEDAQNGSPAPAEKEREPNIGQYNTILFESRRYRLRLGGPACIWRSCCMLGSVGWDGWKRVKSSNVMVFCGAGRVAEDQTG